MLWIKALHIIFVICWFAGIFYLPRLFVNHAMTDSEDVKQRLCIMEHKLYRFMTPLAVLALLFGIILLVGNWTYFASQGWMQVKIVLVLGLVAYHIYCGRLVAAFARNEVRHSHVFFRVINEIPVLTLFVVVILVVVRPF
ncbi:MAG: CopD family protein [Pseudomonadales bacterium]